MIVELAQLTIIAGREAEFESAFRTAISAPAELVPGQDFRGYFRKRSR